MAHVSDEERLRKTRNTARFFTENPSLAWAVLVGVVAWGVFGYLQMPKRKDPEIPIRIAVVVCPWPGMSAERIEESVTDKIEKRLAENPNIQKIETVVRTNVSVSYVVLREVGDVGKELDDLKGRLDAVNDLPQGAGPIQFMRDFRDTAALMLTVASPRASEVEVALRARSVARAIEAVRAGAPQPDARASLVVCHPSAAGGPALSRLMEALGAWLAETSLARDVRPFSRPGFVGLDAQVAVDDEELLEAVRRFVRERLRQSDLHPDVWAPAVIRSPADAEARLQAVAGDRYSYRELDQYTETLQRVLQASPNVARVTRLGVLPEAISLGYSQERLASYGIAPTAVRDALVARNISLPGGVLEAGERDLAVEPAGEITSEKELGDVMIAGSPRGSPVYLRDLFEITRDYQSPPRFLNTYASRDPSGAWQRTRAITLAVMMHSGEQIAEFGAEVDASLASARQLLPDDLVVARTSDQPLQVRENVDLFMQSLWEAVLLVVLVAFIGFWEWRSAVLIALSIPLTLAMTFGLMHLLHVDVQQVSIASLIIALGLLVDDPVVAGDAIQRDIAAGHPSRIAAWLGPTKLANAIVFATLTNIVAYLPLLVVHDHVGDFIYSLPVVLTCSLVASRVVSMTFVPLLGMYLLRRGRTSESPITHRFRASYRRVVGWALDHRWAVLGTAAACLVAGAFLVTSLRPSFFPKDLSYLFYVDVWLPEDVPLSATADAADKADAIIRKVADEYGRAHPSGGAPREILTSVTDFIGGGGPRFWVSVMPEQQQLNYAQLVVQVKDKHDTAHLVAPLQRALTEGMVGARADVRQLETGEPVGVPVSIRFSGLELDKLRETAERAQGILRAIPDAERVREDWGVESFAVKLKTDPDRANLSGVSNLDVALSSVAATSGLAVTQLRERDKQIPVLLRLRPEERARLDDLPNLYVFSATGAQRVPLRQVAGVDYVMEPEKIRRRNHFRTITVSAFPVDGVLPSTVLRQARPALEKLAAGLPPGYRMEIGGEEEAQRKGFAQVSTAMLLSILLIYLCLAFEFRSAVKPFVVFAAIPFGMIGALAVLSAMGAPFGFMAFLGIASLIGVIVSHVIVLFDFIEEAHEAGKPLREALLEAGIVRLRPVLVTVGATVLGLFPLAFHGGPLWEPLCFAQIGGLTAATLITLLLVPVLYAVFVLDLHIVAWGAPEPDAQVPEPEERQSQLPAA